MTSRRTRDREQEPGGISPSGAEGVSPGPQPAASQARLYRPSLLSGSSAARAAMEQGKDRSGTAQMTLSLRYAVRSDVGLLGPESTSSVATRRLRSLRSGFLSGMIERYSAGTSQEVSPRWL